MCNDLQTARGVIYARYSSSGQREESIEGQLRECHEYAERHNIAIVGEYCDHAISGTSDKRPDFQRLIKDSAKGQFSFVITWKGDRFARNRYDSAVYKYRLQQNGVRILYAKESIPDGPEGNILESVMEGFAEYYSANLSQNVKRGLYDSALKLQTLGQFCYGLQKGADGRWEQNPVQAPVVKRIFEEYVAGRPAAEIYRDLNNEGFRTLRGGLFNKNSLRRILKNDKYCGVYRYADIRIEDGIPAIVDRETFEKAQKMLKVHHEKPALKKTDGGFLLTGKLFCGHCGEPMTGDGGTSKTGQIYQYYTCNNRRLKKCDKKRAPKQWIEDVVVEKLVDIVNDDTVIEAFAEKYMSWQETQKKRSPSRGMEEHLKKVEAAIKNTMSLIDNGFITDSLKSHLVELESERVSVENGIAKEKANSPRLTKTEIIYFLKKFRNGKVDDVSWRIYLIETFLQAAYLFDDGKLLLHLNYSGDDSKITVQIAEQAVTEGALLCSAFAPPCPPNGANLNSVKVFFFEGLLVAFTYAQKRS